MSDFSAFALFTAGLACFIPAVAAWTQPVGDSPSGNPISEPGLNSVVPVGTPFTITWQPTTSGTVTIVLLKGPSSNAVPQYAIAEKVANSGTYSWTPSTDLAPGQTGYGLQLIDDENGQYQYSTQWGISNPSYSSSSSSSASATVTVTSSASSSDASSSSASWANGGNPWDTAMNSWFSASAWTTATDGSWSSATGSWSLTSASASATATVTVPANVTSSIASATKNSTISVPTTTVLASASAPGNTSVILPTGSMTVPSSLTSLKTSATGSSSVNSGPSATSSRPAATNGANSMATSFAGLVVAAGVAVFAL